MITTNITIDGHGPLCFLRAGMGGRNFYISGGTGIPLICTNSPYLSGFVPDIAGLGVHFYQWGFSRLGILMAFLQ